MKHPLTAGLVAQWLRMEFTGLAFRDGFDRKSQKFVFPEQRNAPRLRLQPCIGPPRFSVHRSFVAGIA
jgi:hypothetical protein